MNRHGGSDCSVVGCMFAGIGTRTGFQSFQGCTVHCNSLLIASALHASSNVTQPLKSPFFTTFCFTMSIRFGISQGHLCHPRAVGWPCISQGRSSVRRHLAGADAWFLKVTFFVTTKKMIELN